MSCRKPHGGQDFPGRTGRGAHANKACPSQELWILTCLIHPPALGSGAPCRFTGWVFVVEPGVDARWALGAWERLLGARSDTDCPSPRLSSNCVTSPMRVGTGVSTLFIALSPARAQCPVQETVSTLEVRKCISEWQWQGSARSASYLPAPLHRPPPWPQLHLLLASHLSLYFVYILGSQVWRMN